MLGVIWAGKKHTHFRASEFLTGHKNIIFQMFFPIYGEKKTKPEQQKMIAHANLDTKKWTQVVATSPGRNQPHLTRVIELAALDPRTVPLLEGRIRSPAHTPGHTGIWQGTVFDVVT